MASIRIYPYLSPRVIEVLAPDTEITVQELVDLIRGWEDEDDNMSFEFLINAAGKEDLGGGVSVGITASLNNAQIMFEPRTTKLDDGIGRTCDAVDIFGRQLYVDDATFITDGIKRGDLIYNISDGSFTTVLEVISETTISHMPLQGGTNNDWEIGDTYIVYNTEQCSISGGNLVATDDLGASIPSTLYSFGTQVIRSSSSSATLQDIESMRFSSFQGGIWLDETNKTGLASTGKEYPTGTRQQPAILQADAHQLSEDLGLNTIFVLGNSTFSTLVDWSEHSFIGESAIKTVLTIPDAVVANNCEYKEVYLTGVLDGTSVVRDSVIGNLSYAEGYIFNCSLDTVSTITLGTTSIANIIQCYSGQPGVGTPTINCNGSGSLSLRDYRGGIKIINCTSAVSHSIDLASGQVRLDPATVTAGTFIVRGIGKLVDDTTGEPIESDVDANNRPIPTTWNGGVTILNELLTAGAISGTGGGGGSSPWTTAEKDEVVENTRIIKDQSKLSALHAVNQLNNK